MKRLASIFSRDTKVRVSSKTWKRVGRLLVLTFLALTFVLYHYAARFDRLAAEASFEKLTHISEDHLRFQLGTYEQKLAGAAAFAGLQPVSDKVEIDNYTSRLGRRRKTPELIDLWVVQGAHIAPSYLETLQAAQAIESPVMSPLLHDEEAGAAMGAHFILVQWLDGIGKNARWIVGGISAEVVWSSMTEGFDGDLRMRVVDVTDAENPIPLFGRDANDGPDGLISSEHVLPLYGRNWHVAYTSTPQFDQSYASILPTVLLAVGLFLSGVMALVVGNAARYENVLKTAAALRERQLDARLQENRALIETSVSVVFMLDEKDEITFANEAAAALFCVSSKDFVGQKFERFVTLHADTSERDICNATGRMDCGSTLMLDVQTNKWRTAEGRYQTTVLIRDVSDQFNSRRQIEAVHRRYDIALTGSGIGIFEIDLVSGAAVMSETWHKIMGVEGGQEGFDHRRDFLARVHPDDLPELLTADQKCIAGETARSSCEYRVRFSEGWRWMYSDAVPSEFNDDGWATRLIGTQSDITDLRHARNALEVSEARFRMVLEDAPVGMAVMDAEGRFIEVNAALSRLCGHDAEFMKSDMRLSQLLSRRSFVELSRDVRALLRSGGVETYHSQVRVQTLSKEECWGLFHLSWTYDKNRDQYVYIAQITDITQQKRVEQIKTEFIATVSHELRTPLTSIKGALGLLEATAASSLPDTAVRLLEIARVNADRLTVLVNNILDLEKISSGEVSFETAPTPLHALIEDALEHGTEEVGQGERDRVKIEGDPSAMIFADAGRIRQVIVNLLSNACKFSDPDTEVLVRFEVEGDMVRVAFENTGPPIPERFQSQLFDAFTQVDASDTRSKGGTGLGLSIAREIIRRSGGEIGFTQKAERKTVFWFTCPVAVSDDDIEADEFCAFAPNPLCNLKVLHIEADGDFCDVIAAGFAGVADVTSAHTLVEARQVLEAEEWDAIIVDLTLPDGTIFNLLDRICESHPCAQIVSLSSETPTSQDGRISSRLIKSQVDVGDIAQLVADKVSKATPSQSRAAG
ncbi:MAG: ATP-binding protein [Sulfitobacter sp.]